MAGKRGKGRGHHPRHRPIQQRPRGSREAGGPEDLELIRRLRQALRSDSPVDLLMTVSQLLTVTDDRNRNPFAPQAPLTTRADLVESFIGTSYAETTAALTVIRALITDELQAARIGRELGTRHHPLPGWLRRLHQPRIDGDVWLMTHVLGDGDDYLFGITLESGERLTALVYVDHNLGGVVKDGFVIAEPLDTVLDRMRELINDNDQQLSRTDPATARAVLEQAILHGSMMLPPPESDTWPGCRPIVEWMLRMLPADGAVPEHHEWTEQDRAELAHDFLASRFAGNLDTRGHRELLDSLLWFATDYGPAEPLTWSPVRVEMLLADWFPRKITAPVSLLTQLPDVLRGFIRYAHHTRGIRADLTAETLTAVDEWEPDYQREIRTDRLQGPEALLAGMMDAQASARRTDEIDGATWESTAEILLDALDRQVGGRVQLMRLTDDPLPDEPFEWAGIPEDIHPTVAVVLAQCDRVADELLDVEHRTAMRRFLSRAAVGEPAAFRRRASPARGAAAVAWVVAKANHTVGWNGALEVRELLDAFGIEGSVSQRAEPLLRGNGVNPHTLFGSMDLGQPDLLVSRRRADLIESRDYYLSELINSR